MAFVVEDGTGKPDANSYAAVADADAYFADRGNVKWTGTDADKQTALVRATDYLETRFGSRFIGERAHDTQALSWPRMDASGYESDEIPANLKKATFEYAVRTLGGTALAPDPVLDSSGMVKAVSREKLGPIEREYAVATKGFGSEVELLRPYPSADMLLRGLVKPAGFRVIR